jgi:hypothetical protein
MFLTEATNNLVVTSRGHQEGSTQVLGHRYKQLYLSGETSVQTSGYGARPDVRTCWPPSFNNDTLRRLWMQLRALLRLVFCTCCLSIDAASCFASSRAPRLLSAHGCNIVLRAYYLPMDASSCSALAAMPMDTALCSMPAGTTFTYAPLPRLLMKHFQHKAFAATYIQNR